MTKDQDGFLTKDGGRLGAMQRFYYQMCEDLYVRYIDLEKAYQAIDVGTVILEIDDSQSYEAYVHEQHARDALAAASIKLIVIACMCLEAAIYDYAAWHLPARMVDHQIDKLDLYAKWTLVPKLIAQEELAASAPAMGHLKKLIRLRNMLVHSKSRSMPMMQELHTALENMDKRTGEVCAGGHVAMRAVILLSIELDQRLGGRTINPLPHFTDNFSGWQKPFPTALKPLLDICRRISRAASRQD